jgi:hypothetical protein
MTDEGRSMNKASAACKIKPGRGFRQTMIIDMGQMKVHQHAIAMIVSIMYLSLWPHQMRYRPIADRFVVMTIL